MLAAASTELEFLQMEEEEPLFFFFGFTFKIQR